LGIEAWFMLGVLASVFALMAFKRMAPDVVLGGALAIVYLLGLVDAPTMLQGWSAELTVAIGVLYVVGAGVRDTGAMTWVSEILFGRPISVPMAVLRVMVPTALASGFTNNTPLVAMLIPGVSDWANKNDIPVSKLLMPLSYAAILGGTCTLIGTSTNMMVNGQLDRAGLNGLTMFEISKIGIPVTIVGIAYAVLTVRWLLPDRRSAIGQLQDPKEYTVEMMVDSSSPLVGKTIEEAGLRHLPGLFLAEIDRSGTILPAVSPLEKLFANDRLVFVGVVDSVAELQKTRGLLPATDQVFKITAPRVERILVEAVVSDSCPLVGKSIREGRFRSIYQAAVIAVARNGERIRGKIGDIVLRPGDTLLVEAPNSFTEQQRNSRDFFLVSRLENYRPPRHDRAYIALLNLLLLVICVSTSLLSLLQAALVTAGLMLATRCCTVSSARRSVDWSVLITIGASMGLANAVMKTHLADHIGLGITHLARESPWISLVMIYMVTLGTTEMVTNLAAAGLMFPFALSTATNLGVSHMPFVVAVMMAASAAFATPIGYQTNLMVFGPGGYRLGDYVKFGAPLDLLIGTVVILLLPWIWPFHP